MLQIDVVRFLTHKGLLVLRDSHRGPLNPGTRATKICSPEPFKGAGLPQQQGPCCRPFEAPLWVGVGSARGDKPRPGTSLEACRKLRGTQGVVVA